MEFRTGIGHDVHRIAAGRPLVLAGVRIPSDFGLQGHSDADVVLHALCDALLGAAGMGDIGEHFPDSDPANRGADSRRFLADVLGGTRAARYQLCNIDVVIHAERPKLRDFKPLMKESLANMLALPLDAVGVKAGTNEGLDAIGRGEAIACTAVVLLRRD